MNGRKASGVDEITKAMYEENLEDNVEDLIVRMKRQAYKPQSAKRVYIPKPGTDKKRPLGIPAYEDKLVQSALAKILNAIYEQDFMECSFGFRPNRGFHDAIKLLDKIVNDKDIRYVVDTDVKVDGISYCEISEKIGISENSAKVIDFRTKKWLKFILKKEELI